MVPVPVLKPPQPTPQNFCSRDMPAPKLQVPKQLLYSQKWYHVPGRLEQETCKLKTVWRLKLEQSLERCKLCFMRDSGQRSEDQNVGSSMTPEARLMRFQFGTRTRGHVWSHVLLWQKKSPCPETVGLRVID